MWRFSAWIHRRPHLADDAVRNLEGILDLPPIRLEDFAGVAETPRVLGERSTRAEQLLE